MKPGNHSKRFLGVLWAFCGLASGSLAAFHQVEQPRLEIATPESTPIPGSQDPSTPPAAKLSFEDRADIFMARKSQADALEYYQRALKAKGPREAILWNKIGIVHQNLQDFSSARNAYKKAIRLRKDFPEPFNNLGTTYYLEERPKKSLKWYRKAIELNPSNASFHYNLGTALYATKKIELAIESYRYALRLNPDLFRNSSTFGTTMQARPADARYFFYMAKVFASLDRPDDAVRYLRRALEDGFKDTKLLDQDPDFTKIAEYPPYVELRANPPKAL